MIERFEDKVRRKFNKLRKPRYFRYINRIRRRSIGFEDVAIKIRKMLRQRSIADDEMDESRTLVRRYTRGSRQR